MDDKEKLELEIRRVLAQEVEQHRSFLQANFKMVTWGVGVLFVAGSVIFGFLLGKSFNDSQETLISTIDAKVLDYRIVESFQKRLDTLIDSSVTKAIEAEDTKNAISAQVQVSTNATIEDLTNNINKRITEAVNQKVEAIDLENKQKSLLKYIWPKDAIVAFEASTCPEGWSEYERAYGRFLRGIDKSDNPIDPSGLRSPGSVQESGTSLPNNPWTIGSSGGHKHRVLTETDAGRSDGGVRNTMASFRVKGPSVMTDEAGLHTHSIAGGDPETRPANIAVLYCKKEYKNAN